MAEESFWRIVYDWFHKDGTSRLEDEATVVAEDIVDAAKRLKSLHKGAVINIHLVERIFHTSRHNPEALGPWMGGEMPEDGTEYADYEALQSVMRLLVEEWLKRGGRPRNYDVRFRRQHIDDVRLENNRVIVNLKNGVILDLNLNELAPYEVLEIGDWVDVKLVNLQFPG
jgi:hypothetical protein